MRSSRRLEAVDTVVDDLAGWLVTATSRIALDTLRSARVRREEYVGPWLPGPIERARPARRVSEERLVPVHHVVAAPERPQFPRDPEGSAWFPISL